MASTGSERALEVLAWLERGEADVRWWSRYAASLTAEERRRLREGNTDALKRPLEPAFREGQWLDVTPRPSGHPHAKLRVQVSKVELRRGRWLVHFGNVQDFRAPRSASPPGKRTSESLEGVTTLVGAEGRMPDPENVEAVEEWAARGRLRRAELATEATEAIRKAA